MEMMMLRRNENDEISFMFPKKHENEVSNRAVMRTIFPPISC